MENGNINTEVVYKMGTKQLRIGIVKKLFQGKEYLSIDIKLERDEEC